MDIVVLLNEFGATYLGLDGNLTLSLLLTRMGGGLIVTFQIFIITLIGSLPLGVLIALGRMSKVKPLAWLMRLYISFMRGTPLMLQLMAIYYIPYYVFGIKLNLLNIGPMDIVGLHVEIGWVMTACCIGFILNYAAYFAETLPWRYPVDCPRSVRSRRGAGLLECADVHENRASAGYQAHPARHG